MKGYEELRSLFEHELGNQKIVQQPTELYKPIKYTLDLGGKRIRPVLCLMACEMFGRDCREALNQALAIEYFHNFTLIHDDIMDNAPLRRGQPAVYRKWNNNIAILSGDTLFALAYQYAQKVDTEYIHEILTIFNSTAIEVCEGQQYDLNYESDNGVSVQDYLEMIRLKTAVLFAASLKIGAVIGGAGKLDAQNLYDFGVNIGLGFQIRDDLLDTFGDEKLVGKKTGGDILSNKKTYLYLKALELADKRQREALLRLYNENDTGDQSKILQVTSIFNELDIENHAIDLIQECYDKGMKNLDEVQIGEDLKQNLRLIALKMIDRNK